MSVASPPFDFPFCVTPMHFFVQLLAGHPKNPQNSVAQCLALKTPSMEWYVVLCVRSRKLARPEDSED